MSAQSVGTVRADAGRAGLPAVRGRLGTALVLVVTAALVLVAAVATNRSGTSDGLTPVSLTGTPTGPAPIVGQPIPDFSATTVDGATVSMAALKGKVVWLTFGAAWCQPCRAENPDIKAAYEAFKAKGVVVVQVYINSEAAEVLDYANRVGLDYPKIADADDRIASNYRILGIPSHFFVDRDGVLRQLRVGTLDPATMESILTELTG